MTVESGALTGAGRTAPIRTARLLLTPVTEADVHDLWTLYRDPLVARWTGPWTCEAVRVWTEDMAGRWAAAGVGKWMARRLTDGLLVGRGGPSRIHLDGEEVLEIGWVVRDALTGRGYASEIGRATLAWAATFVPELPVVASTELHNHASRAVMHRIGLRQAGTIRREGLVEGLEGLHPDAAFALYRRETR